jgi:hypothetical protein
LFFVLFVKVLIIVYPITGTLISSSDELCTISEKVFFPYHHSVNINIFPFMPRKRPGNVQYNTGNNGNDAVKELVSALEAPIEYDVTNDSLTDLVYSSVLMCHPDCRKELMSNIVLIGGGAMIDGLGQRLVHELNELTPSTIKVRTIILFVVFLVALNK